MSKEPLTYRKQLCYVVQLGVAFMLIFIPFKPIENIISKFYEDMGHDSFGEISLAIMYLTFAFFTAFTPSVIKKIGFKPTFVMAAIFFLTFDAAGFIILEAPYDWLAWPILISSSVLGGIALSCC